MDTLAEDPSLQTADGTSPIAPAAYIQTCNGIGATPVTVEQARLEFDQNEAAGRLLVGTLADGFSWQSVVAGRVFSVRPVSGQELAEWRQRRLQGGMGERR